MAGPEGEVKSKSKAKKLVRSLSKGFRKSLKRMSSGLSSAFSDRKSVIGKDDLDVLDQIAADLTRTEDSPRNSDSPDFLIKAYHPDDASPSERDLSSSRTSQARSLSGASIELGPNGDASVPEPAPAATALDSHQDLAVSSPVEASAEKVSNMTTTEDKLAADRDLKADDASMSQVIHQSSTTPRDQPISDLNSRTLSAEALESDAPASSQSQDVSVAAAVSATYTASTTPTGWNDSAAAVSHPQSGGASPELPVSARDRESPLRESDSDLVFDAAMLSMLDSLALQPGVNMTEDDIQPETAADATPVAANSEPVLVQQCDLAAAVYDPVDPVPIPEESGDDVDRRGSGVDALQDSFEPDQPEWDMRSMPAVIAVGDVEVGLQVFRRPAPVTAASDMQEIEQESMDVHDCDFADDIEQAAGSEEVCDEPERVDSADGTERLAADASVGVSHEVQLTENDSSLSSKFVLELGALDAAGDCVFPPVADNAFEAQLTREFEQPSEVQSAAEIEAAEAHFNVRPVSEEPISPVSCEPVLDQQAAAEPLVSFPISCANSPSSPSAPTTAPKLPEPISQPAVSREPTSRALLSRNSSVLDRYGLDDMFFSLPAQVAAEDNEAAISTVVGADPSASQSGACPDVANAEPMSGVPETLVKLDALQTGAEAAQPAVDVIAPQPEEPKQVLEVDGARVGRFMSGVLENLMVTAEVQGFVESVFTSAVHRAEAELLADKLAEEERAREAAVVKSVFTSATHRAEAELLAEERAQEDGEREAAIQLLTEKLAAEEHEVEAAQQLRLQRAEVSSWVQSIFASATHAAEAELLADKLLKEEQAQQLGAVDKQQRQAADLVAAHQQSPLTLLPEMLEVTLIDADYSTGSDAADTPSPVHDAPFITRDLAADVVHCTTPDDVTLHSNAPACLNVNGSTGEGDKELAALAEEVMDLERALTQLKQDSLYSSDSVAHTSGSDSGSHDDSADDDVQLPLTPQQQAAVVPPPHQDAAEDQHLMEPLQAEAPAQATTDVLECADSDTVLEGSDTMLKDSDTVLEDSTLKVEEEVLDEVPAGAEHTTVPAASKEIALVADPLRLIGKIVFRFATSRVTKAMLLTSASMMVGGVFRGKQRPGHNSSSCCSSQTKQKKKMAMQAKWQ